MGVKHHPAHAALGVEAQRIIILPSIRFRVNDIDELGERPAVVGERDQARRRHVDVQPKEWRLIVVAVIHPAVPRSDIGQPKAHVFHLTLDRHIELVNLSRAWALRKTVNILGRNIG